VPRRWKWLILALFFATVASLIGGAFLAGLGQKDFANRWMTPLMFMLFGTSALTICYANHRYVGWVWTTFPTLRAYGMPSRGYYVILVLLILGGIGLLFVGILFLVRAIT
jgi:hypothetical protein